MKIIYIWMISLIKSSEDRIYKLLDFINESKTPYHATEQVVKILKQAGYKKIKDSREWIQLEASKKYYITRDQSGLLAFQTPNIINQNSSFTMFVSNLDSVSLKLKKVSNTTKSAGFLQLNIEPYGKGKWYTWFDRDLSIAGRILYKTELNQVKSKLIDLKDELILNIPSLAIHLNKKVDEGFGFNLETEMATILGLSDTNRSVKSIIGQLTGTKENDILGLELFLYDNKNATLNYNKELIWGSRLSSLIPIYSTLSGFLGTTTGGFKVLALIDDFRGGKNTKKGPTSNFIRSNLEKVIRRYPFVDSLKIRTENIYLSMVSRSKIICTGLRPTLYPFSSAYSIEMNKGINVGMDHNLIYNTDIKSYYQAQRLSKQLKLDIKMSHADNEDNDSYVSLCSVISPQFSSSYLDLIIPGLAVDSIRSMAGTKDWYMNSQLLSAIGNTR